MVLKNLIQKIGRVFIHMKRNRKMMRMAFVALMLWITATANVCAQDSLVIHRTVKADFVGDARIDTLLQLHILQNEKFPVITGFRIQIYKESGNTALEKALAIRDAFEKRYNVPAYITFNEPYYRVRVGDFRTRLDALRFLEKIKRRYPLAWEIKDDIEIPK